MEKTKKLSWQKITTSIGTNEVLVVDITQDAESKTVSETVSKPDSAKVNNVVYFGGDVQDKYERMKKEYEGTSDEQFLIYNLESTAMQLSENVYENFLHKVNKRTGENDPTYNNGNNAKQVRYKCINHLLELLTYLGMNKYPLHLIGFSRGAE
ncbi:hypothetical protein RFI_31669, partial [Reticulomyxa filosa]